MPHCHTIITQQGIRIDIWRIDETLEQLLYLWGDAQLPSNYKVATATKRQREIVATALLMRHRFAQDLELRHTPNGAPIIDVGNISISHTATHVAIATHPSRQVGIDIETLGCRATRVATRFLSPHELEALPIDDTEFETGHSRRGVAIHFAWSIKEAVYKVHPHAVEFREDIILSPIVTLPTGSVEAYLPAINATSEAHYTLYDGCTLAWVVV
ncbi:MAG: 4'-phosphopantetheinyl transferase superfamily protein [Bacteroidaceae bacterium]|nr:4'-phosphopantetheinyl transferase superfamily protein [Bacteroidaceae bacterium]